MNATHHHYRVGGHLFSLALPPELVPAATLAPYAPFRTEEPETAAAPLFSLTLTADDNDADADSLPAAASSLIRLDDENGSMELFTTPGGGLLIHFARPGCPVCCRLSMDSRYRHARAVLRDDARERRYALDNSLMLLYAFASAPHATLLLHASVIENDGRGYLFLGRSGTGKSTHTRLWTEHIAGSRLLNDDNPVVRLSPDGAPLVYGSPWSGKTYCYRNLGIPAAAFVRLTQAPRNSITRLRGVQAYAALMPACSCMKWDGAMAAAVHRTLERLIAAVPVFRLECLPDGDAARLCAQTVTASDAAHTPGHAESSPCHAELAPCHSERSEICGQASAETKLVSAMPSVSKSETAQPDQLSQPTTLRGKRFFGPCPQNDNGSEAETKPASAMPDVSKPETAQPDQPSQSTAHAPCHAERSEASQPTAHHAGDSSLPLRMTAEGEAEPAPSRVEISPCHAERSEASPTTAHRAGDGLRRALRGSSLPPSMTAEATITTDVATATPATGKEDNPCVR